MLGEQFPIDALTEEVHLLAAGKDLDDDGSGDEDPETI